MARPPQVGKKTLLNFSDSSYVVDISWDHSGMSDGINRLREAITVVAAFPHPTKKAKALVDLAQLCLKVGCGHGTK